MKNVFCILLFLGCSAYSQIDALIRSSDRPRTLSQRWELDSTATRGTFRVTPYKPIFVLPFRWSNKPNERPRSGNGSEEYIVEEGDRYNRVETKFQISFKTKVMQDVFWGKGDLWVAYTQAAHWQVYNGSISRPFREINYEPELILNFPVKFKLFGFNGRMVGMAFNHQSNGKSLPFSRSWNRIIFHAGLEYKNWTVYARPWIRIPDKEDDNPDIADQLGRADLNVIYTSDGHIFSLIGSHNLSFGTAVKGNLTFSYSFPIKGNLRGHLQASHGYGETLIDYNHRQTTVGIGCSLVEWL
ncbi:phospholipase A [Flavobacterium selenitireducens]|uniref:phospholipase A n=1 Tax=Flavobacterium selenitireducens TaxID=2722704 RepID=UPI00168B7D7E|nr:phospholipase A [Flavobacterium selenitireducens]MBD3580908.1 phospholipase A [Flavobacterium selenitireducens]